MMPSYLEELSSVDKDDFMKLKTIKQKLKKQLIQTCCSPRKQNLNVVSKKKTESTKKKI